MIVEMRTYLLKPGAVASVEELFLAHLPHRTPLSPLAGLWHTLTGRLNAIVHMWPYADIDGRDKIRTAMMMPPKWPPPLREFIVEMHSTILKPAPFSPGMRPGKHGSLYEFCVDEYAPGGVAECQAGWSAALPARASLAPLIFCGTSDIGALNRWFHIWAYRDAAHRDEVHASADGRLSHSSKLLHQELFLARPAVCSPLN
jgi:hypothetical protein